MPSETSRRMVVIDCFSLLFRAFFGGRYLSTPDGRPTGALYGFAGALLNILRDLQPDLIYAAWDAPAKTFRHDRYDQYKAHRPEIADDLRQQVPVAHDLVDAFGIPAVMVPGFEADDLIGTLATRGVKEGCEVVIVTGDSDQLQLVGGGVKVYMTQRGISEFAIYDVDDVVRKLGVPPERVPDYKALVGDSSDNIPGVPGVGPKNATRLLHEFGSVEALLAAVDRIEPERMRKAVAENAEQARMALGLATIDCSVPFEEALRPYAPTADDWSRLRAMFGDLDFRSLIARLPESEDRADDAAVGEAAGVTVTRVRSDAELAAALAACHSAPDAAIRLVTEGAGGAMQARLRAVAWACGPDQATWVLVTRPEDGLLTGLADDGYAAPIEALEPLLRTLPLRRVGFQTKADCIVLTRRGMRPAAPAVDLALTAYLINPGRSTYVIDDLVQEHLRTSLPAAALQPEEKAATECAMLLRLKGPMRQRIDAEGLGEVLDHIEMPLSPILAEMEMTGVPVDRAWLERLSGELGAQADQVAGRIYDLAGERFSIGSTQQLQRVLFEKLKLPAGKKIKTGFSTGADLLQQLAGQHEIAARVLEYREVTKLKNTYADALPKLIHPDTGRIHTSLNQTVASTGRLSSSDPNLQNIPIRSEAGRKIRKAFIAPSGQVLLSCDYSQIELRVFAHVTRDPEMLRAFAADEDIHAATATRLFNVDLEHVLPEQRRVAKTVNFAVIYGQSDFGLASTLGISTGDARAFKDAYFAQFPGVKLYTERTRQEAHTRGFVQTLLGRRRYLPEIASGNRNVAEAAERAAVNMPIQGTAADIMKLAMLAVHARLEQMCYNCALLLQVHDELVFALDEDAVPEVTPQVVECMEQAYTLDVRLRVDAKVGRDWSSMRRVDSAAPPS